MKRNIWVFRYLGKSGNPERDACPHVDLRSVNEYRRKVVPKKRDEEIAEYEKDVFPILKNELFDHGRLRQWWGYESEKMDLDLKQKGNIWIENYMKLVWRLEGIKIPIGKACGRWHILNRMTEMKIEDIIFIPRIPVESKFTVATVDKKKYFFKQMKEYSGYGHGIAVKNIEKYSYNKDFPPKTFNPYRTAISEIKEHHENFDIINDFVENNYL